VLEAAAAPARAVETEVILSELLALRKIVINLLYRREAHEPLTERSMRELIEAADSDKIPKAIERLQAVRTTQAEDLSDDQCEKFGSESPGDGASPGGLAER
jgi:hypothetical protein